MDFAVSSFFSSVTSLNTATAPGGLPARLDDRAHVHHVGGAAQGDLAGEDHEPARGVE